MENTSEFWADVSVAVVSPVAIAAGFARGAYDASTDNGAFTEGFNAAADPIIKGAKKFGAEHGATITKAVLTGAAGALGARIVSEGLKRIIN
jgi:ABC-type phosphate/phosphonate transport system permease subunit